MENSYKDEELDLKELLNMAYKMNEEKYRLVQICCTALKDIYNLNYSFSKGYEFVNYTIKITKDDEIPSISNIFKPAFLYENEMKDLFGIKIKYIAIDYKGHFYDIKGKTPYEINRDEEGEK
ncbi:NADH-quinone oxidoreductase subunit C [Clostridium celatum]|uniref:NADH-quinone oxidoreductase subunit C n=1 Tax=Clostridium celatum TaxID=36834 RepID=UPI00189798BB|nr:NADH-quinone oxidoreductase subunit C [Clostridium celatum]MCE9654707.1 NADH-quinone oxidoreductase subunit C [Clostridium celatum]